MPWPARGFSTELHHCTKGRAADLCYRAGNSRQRSHNHYLLALPVRRVQTYGANREGPIGEASPANPAGPR